MKIINQLVKLQDSYEEIRQYNKILKDGSHIYLLKKLKKDFEECKLKYRSKVNKLEELKKDLIAISCEVNKEKHKLQEKEVALSKVDGKDHKFLEESYTAVEMIKVNVKKLEDRSLILMEEEENLEIEREKLRVELVNIKNNFYTKKEEVNGEISLAHQKIDDNKRIITSIQETLPGDVRKKFEDLVERKNTALAIIEGGMCLGCRMKVSSMTIDRIYKGEEIVCCNNCERILYYNSSNLKIAR